MGTLSFVYLLSWHGARWLCWPLRLMCGSSFEGSLKVVPGREDLAGWAESESGRRLTAWQYPPSPTPSSGVITCEPHVCKSLLGNPEISVAVIWA